MYFGRIAGYVAIGSEKGEIRFFNKINMKAKTLLPGLGGVCDGERLDAEECVESRTNLVGHVLMRGLCCRPDRGY
jgi:hypothetical protein